MGRALRRGPLALFTSSADFVGTFSRTNIVVPVERELDHVLGRQGFVRDVLAGPLLSTQRTVHDGGLQFVQLAPNAVATFNEPNARTVFGRPSPGVSVDPGAKTVVAAAAVNAAVQDIRLGYFVVVGAQQMSKTFRRWAGS